MNIIFVKWGTKYSSKQVNNLYRDIRAHEEIIDQADYFCYTDDPIGLDPDITVIPIPTKPALKVWWNKLAMFDKNFPLEGDTLYFDIDTKIIGDPFTMEYDFSKLTLIDCHWKDSKIYDRPTNYDVRINSSVMAWDADNPDIHEIWDWFINSGQRDYFLRKYVGIDRYLVHENFEYDTFNTDYILSYMFEDNSKEAIVITYEECDFERANIL